MVFHSIPEISAKRRVLICVFQPRCNCRVSSSILGVWASNRGGATVRAPTQVTGLPAFRHLERSREPWHGGCSSPSRERSSDGVSLRRLDPVPPGRELPRHTA